VNGKLAEKLLDMSKGVGVAVVFESPYRVENLLTVLRDALPDTRVFIANDLTKQYEWTLEGGVQDVLDAFKQRVKALKGEYCLAFRFPPIADKPEEETIRAEAWILDALYSGKTMPEAVEYAQAHDVSRNEAYRASIGVKEFLGKR
jgi:16S rRNA C1402 (ribose-2'-O) methylase RsmI